MTRPSFSVGAATVGLLVLFGACRRAFAPLIPAAYPAPPGATLFERAGAEQAIAWRPFVTREQERLARDESRRRGVPLLLFLGRASSPAARSLDSAFLDGETARMIMSRFVPARLDLTRRPNWAGALYPLARTAMWMDAGCQLVVLDPNGRPVAAYVPSDLGRLPNRDEVGALIEYARGEIERVGGRTDVPYDAERRRTEEAELAARAAAEATAPGERIEPSTGLVVARGGAYASAEPIELLARSGLEEEARRALRALARSRMFDPIGGGVFSRRGGPPNGGSERIETSDTLRRDAAFAELAQRLSRGGADEGLARFAAQLAESAFRRLDSTDPGPDEGIAGSPTAFVSDVGPDGYSRAKSLTFARLRSAGVGSDAAAIRAAFAASESQALGRRDDFTSLPTRIESRALAALRPDGDTAVEARGIVASDASVLARLIGAARLSGDGKRLDLLLARLARLEGSVGPPDDEPTLASDLARADAAFAAFLARGLTRDLERAGRLIEGAAGAFRSKPSEANYLTPGRPDLADDEGESPTAAAIRLADGIGRALSIRRGGAARAAGLLAFADRLAGRSERLLLGRGPEVAGLLNATDGVRRSEWRAVRGRAASSRAALLARREPFRLIVPALGSEASRVIFLVRSGPREAVR